jgi:uracil-DNA glycosylase
MPENGRRVALRSLAIGYQIDRTPALARLRVNTEYVPGRGPLSPRYAFIGEAPGAAEEKLRRPFCGPSGRMLDDLLKSIRLYRDQVWVTNVVKYRPPHNRDPHPDERQASLPYLKRELKLVAPQYVVTLGRHALAAMDPTLRIAEVHGQWQTVAGWPLLMPLYHPAVALYRSSMRDTLMSDFAHLLEVPNA